MGKVTSRSQRDPLVASALPRETVLRHLRLSEEYVDESEWEYISALVSAANSYICDQCGVDQGYIDEHEDLAIAALVLVADMYDQRERYVSSAHDNLTLRTILGHHDHNLGGCYGD